MAYNCTICGKDNGNILWPVGFALELIKPARNEAVCDDCLVANVTLLEAKEAVPDCSYERLENLFQNKI